VGNERESLLEKFEREVEVVYRNDTYSVRDNGAVCRRPRPGGNKRRLDDVWTFGSPSDATGYMHIGSEVVHRIVATAFHGEQPSEKHIVDHLDTNRRNNRAENLRWITRLDNVLLNPITRHRIEIAYGSIEAFLANPRSPLKEGAMKNFEWMRTVSKEEAQESYDRLRQWAESRASPNGGVLGEWVFGRKPLSEDVIDEPRDKPSLTPAAIQRNWRTPVAFALCPEAGTPDALGEYAARLTFGTVFAADSYGESRTVVAEGNDNVLSIVCNLPQNTIKGWALAKVTVENDHFIHESVGSYFTLQGALKAHCRLLDAPFGESIDDFA
jgi:hypothetical protein